MATVMKKIIFADDDSSIQNVVTLLLEGHYAVNVFTHGEPLLKNEFEVPDLFIIDRLLAGVDGLDVCRFLKSQDSTKNVPVILISATPDITSHARSAGADGVIKKPFAIGELRQLIASHIQ
jgi:DNA-binding response OmpR family regulator